MATMKIDVSRDPADWSDAQSTNAERSIAEAARVLLESGGVDEAAGQEAVDNVTSVLAPALRYLTVGETWIIARVIDALVQLEHEDREELSSLGSNNATLN